MAGAAPAAQPAAPATLAFARTGPGQEGVYLLAGNRARLLVPDAAEPTWSPDARRVAYVAPGSGGASDLYVVDADGTNAGRITRTDGVDETSPNWSPDGTRLVVERAARVVTVRADGSVGRVLASGWEPEWSPAGEWIAYSDGVDLYLVSARGGSPRKITATPAPESSPAWSPDARRLAYVSEETGASDIHLLDLRSRQVTRITADTAVDSSPAFTANGRSVVFVSDRSGVETLWRVPASGGTAVPVHAASSADPAPRPRPSVLELSPDLDQQPPTDLDVRPTRGGFRLWFTSASDSVGLGPLIVNGRRKRAGDAMHANQRVRLTNGRWRTNPEIGAWHYNASSDHSHWHLIHFQRYELRRLDGSVLVRDRKSGFCIGDRYGVAPGRVKGRTPTPVFRGFCNLYRPTSTAVDGGTSGVLRTCPDSDRC